LPLPPELLASFRNAHYTLLGTMRGEPGFVLKVGEKSAALDKLLDESKASCAAWLTAVNPESKPTPAPANAARMRALEEELAAAGYACYAGEASDPQGGHREPSLLVVGIPRADAQSLGLRFGQNAILWIEKGAAPELVALR
jgi:hypothetical protein